MLKSIAATLGLSVALLGQAAFAQSACSEVNLYKELAQIRSGSICPTY